MSYIDIVLLCVVILILIGCVVMLDKLQATGKEKYKNYKKEATERISNTSDIIVWANLREHCVHLHNDGRVCLSGLTDCLFVSCPIRKQNRIS